MRTSFHHQPEAQHPNVQLSTSWQADYPIFWHWLCKNSEFSHSQGTKRTYRDVFSLSTSGGKANINGLLDSATSVEVDPKADVAASTFMEWISLCPAALFPGHLAQRVGHPA